MYLQQIRNATIFHLNHCIHNSAEGSSFRTGAEQSVLPVNNKWPDCIFFTFPDFVKHCGRFFHKLSRMYSICLSFVFIPIFS